MPFLSKILTFLIIISTAKSYAFETARQLSFAGGGSLSPHGVDALTLNPATLNIDAGVTFGGGYNFGDVSDGAESSTYYVWFKDSISSAFITKKNKQMQKKMDGLSGFPVAAAFAFGSLNIEDRSSTELLNYRSYNLGLSSLVTKKVSVGVGLSYFDKAQGVGFKESFSTADIGVVYWFKPKLKLGLSAIDILNTSSLDFIEELNPQRLRLSAAYSLNTMKVYADLERPISGEFEGDTNLGLSLEAALKEFLSVRLGAFKRQGLDDVDFGAGLSFTGPNLQIHYGFRQNSGTDTFLNSIDFSMPL